MQDRDLTSLAVIAFLAWAMADLFGQVRVFGLPLLIDNVICFKYLGCNANFFGYDAIVHVLAGVVEVLFLLWLTRYPAWDFRHVAFLRTLMSLVGMVILASFAWELIEYCADLFRANILGENIVMPNTKAQATAADTMGDITVSTMGAAWTLLMLRLVRPFWVSK